MLLGFFSFIILGLVFGSFVSALTWRIPRGISFVKGRSGCPKCNYQLRWIDNIPLLSFILLSGKCRNCKKKISLRYPLIELSTTLGFVIIGLLTVQGPTLYVLIMFLILLTIFVIDLENQIIPDSLVFTGIGFVFIYSLFFNQNSIIPNIFSGLISASLLMLIHIFTKGRGMGLGDVKFAVFGGMLVGLKLVPVWLLASFLTGGIVGSILILFGKAKMKTKIAFGPFLVLGIGITAIFGDAITRLFF